MKNILHRAAAFSLAICMSATMLFTGAVYTVSAAATEFDIMLERLETLEQLANAYHTANYKSDSVDQLVLSYIRSARYTADTWTIMAGEADNDFIGYVAKESPDTAQLRNIYLLTLPNGDRTDFIHMFAEMNMALRSHGDLGGWLGDTCELVRDIQNESGDVNTLEKIAKTHFRIDGGFDAQDWVADLDGYNLCKMKEKSETWAACLARYFTPTLTEKQRVGRFIQLNLGSSYTSETISREKYRSFVSSRYSSVELTALRISMFGLPGPDTKYHNAACYAVADYLFDTVHAPVPDETMVRIDFANESLEIAAGVAVNSAKGFRGTGYVSGDPIAPGATFYIRGMRDVEAGSFIPSGAVTITVPQRPAAPAVPQLADATVSELNFDSTEGVEYTIDGGKTWQSESCFTGLTPYTDYSVICRYRATETEFASAPSEACRASTLLPEGIYVDDRGIYLADDGKICYMTVAAYRDGQLVSIQTAALDDGVWSSSVPDGTGIDSVRVFVLDEHFLPLIEAYPVVLKPM